VDPISLQRWATNLLAQHPNESWLNPGTNIPPGLDRAFRHGMHVLIGGNPSHVAVFDGEKGGPFLRVGPPLYFVSTNDVDYIITEWKPGIYIVGLR
jgi:hypothetical protein